MGELRRYHVVVLGPPLFGELGGREITWRDEVELAEGAAAIAAAKAHSLALQFFSDGGRALEFPNGERIEIRGDSDG